MDAAHSTILTTLRRGIWRVTVDGAFYGDYRTARHANDSAEAAAVALRQTGRVVKVLTEPVIGIVS
ncbi:hypothetical protein U91I_00750 [alpha proteobacterium U9-1i]|nr:hypothetical protein U91I_00750 [alpha proteobacterium U9-1i]